MGLPSQAFLFTLFMNFSQVFGERLSPGHLAYFHTARSRVCKTPIPDIQSLVAGLGLDLALKNQRSRASNADRDDLTEQ